MILRGSEGETLIPVPVSRVLRQFMSDPADVLIRPFKEEGMREADRSGVLFLVRKVRRQKSKGNFRILRACERFASERGVETVEVGINLGRSKAYKEMLSLGFRTEFQGVAMQRPNEAGFNRSGVFAIDDWR